MTDAKQAVRQAGQILQNHDEIGKMPHVLKWWQAIKWREIPGQAAADAELDGDSILLYPRLAANPHGSEIVLREFGAFLYAQLPDADKRHWEKKHSLPTAQQIDAFNSKINTPDSKWTTYKNLTDSFSTAVDRLVVLNLSNALLANGVSFGSVRGIDVRSYGATSAYANLKRYHSLLPLTTAYADRLFNASYGAAFAALIVNDLKNVRESSVAAALRRLIIGLADRAR